MKPPLTVKENRGNPPEIGLVEGCWLAAVVVVPLLFHLHTDTIFEPEKVAVLRSLLLVVLGAWVVAVIRGWRPSAHHFGSLWRTPIGLAGLLTLASYLLSNLTAVDPALSFWGAYPRRQGFVTALALVFLFASLVLALERRIQLERLVGAMVLSTVPLVLYALIQRVGLDPIPWAWSAADRPTAQAGNPVFLAAHLIMVMPLTVSLVIRGASKWKHGGGGNHLVPLVGISVLLFLQATVLLATQSRGPLVGLGVGLVFFGLVALRRTSRRFAGITVLVALGLAGPFAAVVIPGAPLQGLKDVPGLRWTGLHRFTEAFEVGSGTQNVRILLWDSTVDLVKEDPGRLLQGYGPESLILMHHRHYRPRLSSLEGGGIAADRAHNRTLDLLASRGLLGVVADSLLFLGVLLIVLRRYGVVRDRKRTFILAAAMGGGSLLGLCAAVATGSWGLLGPLLPLGLVAGLLGFLGLDLLLSPTVADETGEEPGPSLVLLAMGAATLAHFVETQVGIETVATRLYLWVMAGAVLVVGSGALGDDEGRLEGKSGEGKWGIVVALTMITAAFGFTGIPKPLGSVLPVSFLMVVGCLSAGFLLGPRREGRAGWLFLRTCLPVLLVLQAAQTIWPKLTGQYALTRNLTLTEILPIVQRLSFTLSVFTGMVILIVILFSLPGRSFQVGWRPRLLLSFWPLLLLAPAILGPLKSSRADVASHVGRGYEYQGLWPIAAYLYGIAAELEPAEEVYLDHLAKMRVEVARAEVDQPQRERSLDAAVQAAKAARDLRIQDPRFHRMLGTIEMEYGMMVQDPVVRALHYERSEDAFEAAVEAGPRLTATWVEWGRSLLWRGDPSGALEKQGRAEALDPEFLPALRLKGDILLSTQEWAGARDAFQRAVQLNPDDRESWRGLGSAHAQLDAREAAVDAYLRAIEAGAADVLTYRNLALMLGELGQISRAIPYAERALDVAPPALLQDVQALLQQLRELETH